MYAKDIIPYFLQLSKGSRRSTFPEFRDAWYEAQDLPSARDAATVFFHASNATKLNSKFAPFLMVDHRNEARRFFINESVSWGKRSKALHHHFDAAALTSIMAAHDITKLIPSATLFDLWRVQTKNCMADMDARSLTSCIRFLSRGGHHPGNKWMEAWADSVRPRLGEFDAQQMSTIIYGLAIMDCIRGDKREEASFRPLAMTILDMIQREVAIQEPETLRSEVYCAALWFNHDLYHKLPIEPETKGWSTMDHGAAEHLRYTGLAVDKASTVIPFINHAVDVSLRYDDNQIGLELDGGYHFLIEPECGVVRYDGTTQIQAALAEKTKDPDLRLIKIPLHIYEMLQNDTSKWKQILKTACALPATASHIVHEPDVLLPSTDRAAWQFDFNGPYNPVASFR